MALFAVLRVCLGALNSAVFNDGMRDRTVFSDEVRLEIRLLLGTQIHALFQYGRR